MNYNKSKPTLILSFSVAVTCSLPAYSIEKDLTWYDNYMKDVPAESTGSISYMQLRARTTLNYSRGSANQVYRKAADGLKMTAETAKSDQELNMQFEQTRNGAFSPIPYGLMKGTSILMDWTREILGPVTETTGPLINAGIKVANQAPLGTMDQLKIELNEVANHELINELQKRQAAHDSTLASLAGMKPEQAYQALYGNDANSNLNPQDFPVEAQAIVIDARMTAIKNNMTQDLLNLRGAQADIQTEVDQSKQNLTGLANAFVQYRNENQAQMEEITSIQNEINEKMQGLAKQGQLNQDNLEFIKEFMFGKMSPEEQLTSIQIGMLDTTLTVTQKADKEKQLELVIKRQELNTAIVGFMDNSGKLISIAQRLNVAPDVVKTLRDAHRVGMAGYSAFNSIMSGNYLAAASSVLDAFGIGGPSPEESRHAEIMSALQEIQEISL